MNKKKFILSSAGLKNIIFTQSKIDDVKVHVIQENPGSQFNEDDFYFFLGDKEIQMNRILAEFISPRVSHMHQTDLTINSLDLTSPFFNQNDVTKFDTKIPELIDNFIKLSKGMCIDVDEEMIQQILELSISLGKY